MSDDQAAQVIARVRELARALAADPGSGGHVHLDDPDFAGLVPAFTDPAWINLGSIVAGAASGLGTQFLVAIPLGFSAGVPELIDLAELEELSLYPHDAPPCLYILPEASAHDRRRDENRLVCDLPGSPEANAWIGRRLEDDPGLPSPLWTFTLYYETKAG